MGVDIEQLKDNVFNSIKDWKTDPEKVRRAKPILYRLLVKVDTTEQVEKVGSIYIAKTTDPYAEQMAKEYGVVLDMGDCAYTGYKHAKTVPKIGDRVMFFKYAGQTPFTDDPSIRVINDDDVSVIMDFED